MLTYQRSTVIDLVYSEVGANVSLPPLRITRGRSGGSLPACIRWRVLRTVSIELFAVACEVWVWREDDTPTNTMRHLLHVSQSIYCMWRMTHATCDICYATYDM